MREEDIIKDFIIKNGVFIGRDKCEDSNLVLSDGKITSCCDEQNTIFRNTVDAGKCYIVPGLIDFHTHFFHGGTTPGLNADIAFLPGGVTTAVDQGSAGHSNIAAFLDECHHRMINTKIFMHVTPFGQIYLQHAIEQYRPEKWMLWEYEAALRKGGDRIVGLKMRFQKDVIGDNDPKKLLISVLKLANELKLKVCIHMTDPALPMQEVVKMLRPGDIVAHVFHGRGHTIFDDKGNIFPEIIEAQQRGVIFDAAHGSVNFSPAIAKLAIEKGFYPDIISTDNTKYGWLKPDVGSLCHIMSQFLALGMPLNDVIKCVTANPAKALGLESEIGSLKEGANADIAFLKIYDREIRFINCFGEEHFGTKMIVPSRCATACAW